MKWECGFLDDELLAKIKSIVESGNELALWKRLGATKSELIKQEKSKYTFNKIHNIKINNEFDIEKGRHAYGNWDHLGEYIIRAKTTFTKIIGKLKLYKYLNGN